jgi:membrane-associated HD superfamily phosphohydrolase
MICDTVEAATRANSNMSYNEMCNLVNKLIKEKLDNGQFNDCDLTMRDIHIIENTIVNVLPGIYHNRVKYDNKQG